MASLIHVTNSYGSILVRHFPLRLVSSLRTGPAILTAVIRQHGEPTPELEEQKLFVWHEPLRVENLEVIAAKDSEVELHDPVESGSEDSDALYFGRSDKLGILLQYMGPTAWRTKDAVAHTSVHHHEASKETYHLLHGAASIELRDVRTGKMREVLQEEPEDSAAAYLRGFTVRPYEQHPVVASKGMNGTHSVMLLVTNPPNNTRSDHHQDGLFRDLFPEVIAFYTQRMHDPFAMD